MTHDYDPLEMAREELAGALDELDSVRESYAKAAADAFAAAIDAVGCDLAMSKLIKSDLLDPNGLIDAIAEWLYWNEYDQAVGMYMLLKAMENDELPGWIESASCYCDTIMHDPGDV